MPSILDTTIGRLFEQLIDRLKIDPESDLDPTTVINIKRAIRVNIVDAYEMGRKAQLSIETDIPQMISKIDAITDELISAHANIKKFTPSERAKIRVDLDMITEIQGKLMYLKTKGTPTTKKLFTEK